MEEQKNRREMETQQPWRSLRFSFRSATIIVCFLNLIAALLLLQGFLSSASTRKFSTPRPDTGMPLSCSLYYFFLQSYCYGFFQMRYDESSVSRNLANRAGFIF
ncbi:hypothetical protein CK203_035953 [Vitis vinifera]|uniref:Uncharacterized protein n=1 Tax=Vitis vinifera TaxID=29760 RepID=A0A438I015_VITVI|nr:hypothetical protein CK203_035953 [Vitis vinifera]